MRSKSASTITKETVSHVAELAKLEFRGNETKKFASQLARIFDYVSQIGKMRTENVPGTFQVTGLVNRFRPDKVDTENMLTQEQALIGAKHVHNGYFLVGSVFGRKKR